MANTPATLRPARPEDAATVTALALRSKASNGYDAAFMAACRDELTFDTRSFAGGETWLCEVAAGEDGAGRVLGFFDLRQEAGTAEIYAFFVEPACKGQGVGRSLWEKLEARATALGATQIGADSDPAAVPFYRRMGLDPAGCSPSGSIPGRMLPRLVKVL